MYEGARKAGVKQSFRRPPWQALWPMAMGFNNGLFGEEGVVTRLQTGPKWPCPCSQFSFERWLAGSGTGQRKAHIAVQDTGVEEFVTEGNEAQPCVEGEGVGLGGELHGGVAVAAGGLDGRRHQRRADP